MSILIVLGYILFVLVLLCGVLASLLGVPGTVLIVLDGLVFSAATHWQRPNGWILLVLAVLSLVAETMDNVLSAVATRYGGGSSQTGWMAMLGGIAGALVGSWIGPVIGAIGLIGGPISFILCVIVVPLGLGAVGGYGAAYWYERRQGKSPAEAKEAGKGALFGRLLGAMGKTLIAIIMSGILLWVVFVHA
jgi:hypothetical protein